MKFNSLFFLNYYFCLCRIRYSIFCQQPAPADYYNSEIDRAAITTISPVSRQVTTFGRRQKGDSLIYRYMYATMRATSGPNGLVVQRDLPYPPTNKKIATSNFDITCVQAIDIRTKYGGGTVSIVSGGVGYRNVTVRLTSFENKGFYFIVKIYGKGDRLQHSRTSQTRNQRIAVSNVDQSDATTSNVDFRTVSKVASDNVASNCVTANNNFSHAVDDDSFATSVDSYSNDSHLEYTTSYNVAVTSNLTYNITNNNNNNNNNNNIDNDSVDFENDYGSVDNDSDDADGSDDSGNSEYDEDSDDDTYLFEDEDDDEDENCSEYNNNNNNTKTSYVLDAGTQTSAESASERFSNRTLLTNKTSTKSEAIEYVQERPTFLNITRPMTVQRKISKNKS